MGNPKTFGLTHLALVVRDLERTRAFYTTAFDMEVMYHMDTLLQLTTPGANDIIVFEQAADKRTGDTGGILHFGFRLKSPGDMDEVESKILAAGGEILDKGSFVRGEPYMFFKDPDGYLLEVWYEKPSES
jgi:catechol 2,3-dioxygenase-like lactoylglutathione lyase family enzyme